MAYNIGFMAEFRCASTNRYMCISVGRTSSVSIRSIIAKGILKVSEISKALKNVQGKNCTYQQRTNSANEAKRLLASLNASNFDFGLFGLVSSRVLML